MNNIPVLHVTERSLAEAYENALVRLYNEGTRFETQYDKPGDPPSLDCTMNVTIMEPDTDALALSPLANTDKLQESIACALAEGVALSRYRFDRYITQDSKARSTLRRLTIMTESESGLRHLRSGLALARAVCEGTYLARDLANAPFTFTNRLCFGEKIRLLAGIEFGLTSPSGRQQFEAPLIESPLQFNDEIERCG